MVSEPRSYTTAAAVSTVAGVKQETLATTPIAQSPAAQSLFMRFLTGVVPELVPQRNLINRVRASPSNPQRIVVMQSNNNAVAGSPIRSAIATIPQRNLSSEKQNSVAVPQRKGGAPSIPINPQRIPISPDGNLANVLDSRSAIFKDRSLSFPEKNQLMWFFKLVQAHWGGDDTQSNKISEEYLEKSDLKKMEHQQSSDSATVASSARAKSKENEIEKKDVQMESSQCSCVESSSGVFESAIEMKLSINYEVFDDYSSAYSELQSDVLQESSDLDFSDYNPSMCEEHNSCDKISLELEGEVGERYRMLWKKNVALLLFALWHFFLTFRTPRQREGTNTLRHCYLLLRSSNLRSESNRSPERQRSRLTMAVAGPDPLFGLRNKFYLGAYQAAINNSEVPNLSPDNVVERDALVFRSYIALGSYQLVISEIDASASTPLQAVKLLAIYLSDPEEKEMVISSLHELLGDDTQNIDNNMDNLQGIDEINNIDKLNSMENVQGMLGIHDFDSMQGIDNADDADNVQNTDNNPELDNVQDETNSQDADTVPEYSHPSQKLQGTQNDVGSNPILRLIAGIIFMHEQDYNEALKHTNAGGTMELHALNVQIFIKMHRSDYVGSNVMVASVHHPWWTQ